jgi:WD40 repeat protein
LLEALIAGWTVSGQPAKPPAPALPPINPTQAHFDGTVGGLEGPGLALAVSHPAEMVIAGCEDGYLCYWYRDASLGLRLGTSPAGCFKAHQGQILAVASAGPITASAGVDKKILVSELPAEKVLHTLEPGAVVRSLALTADGKVLASAGDDGAVQLWDLATGKPGLKLTGSSDWLFAVAFSADGKAVAAGGVDGQLRLWDAATAKKLLEMPALAPAAANQPPNTVSPIAAVAFAPDGKSVVAGGLDGLLYQFQLPDGKLLRTYAGHTSAITSLAFHPGGTVLVSGSKDRTIRLWNPANGQLIKALEGHTAWVQGVALFAQSTRLASVSADQTVRLWDLSEPLKK